MPVEAKAETPALALTVSPPRTGVEIVLAELRKGVWYYSVRDLRNMRIVQNVTLKSARRLWQYAISEREKNPLHPSKLTWVSGIAIAKTYKRAGKMRYDLAQRAGDQISVYYGVSDDGIHDQWRNLIEGEPIAEEEIPEVAEPEARAAVAAEYDETAGLVGEASLEIVEAPEAEAQPLIIEEEIPSQIETELPLAPEARDEKVVTWFEGVGETEDETAIAEEEPETLPDEMTPTSVKESPAPESPAAPPVETSPTAIVPTPPAPLVAKTRAQEWREQLERAMEEARKAREGSRMPNSGDQPQKKEGGS